MEKRYQVFISSTYADLKEERRIVMQAVLDLACIPAGMELFPAADEQQFEYIKRVIDDSDYYLLIIGGRYGSITAEGISYTEKEYEYAVSRNLPVIAFLHEAPGSIAYEKSETEPVLRERLHKFRKKVGANRLIKPWRTPEQLASLVTSSVAAAIRTSPATGWVRATMPASTEVLAEINELRKQKADLERRLATLDVVPNIPDLAELEDTFSVRGVYYKKSYNYCPTWTCEPTWRQIFDFIGPYLVQYPSDIYVKGVLTTALFALSGRDGSDPSLDDQIFRTIAVQLQALGLVTVEYAKDTRGGMGLFWSLTIKGEALMVEFRAVRKASSPA